MSLSQITQRQMSEAVAILRAGGVVALPSETVYGLGARADNEQAVARIFELKGRPNFNPLISHCADLAMAQDYADFSPLALELAREFWPGALTLVLKRKSDAIAPNVSAGLDTLALRVPAHPIFHEVIHKLGVPIAAPSANVSGKLSPTQAHHVKRDFGDKLDLIVDGGATEYGLESTIIMVDGSDAKILRHGAIAREDIEAKLGISISEDTHAEKPISPGQLLRHYAPKARLVLNATRKDAQGDALWLGFGDKSAFDLSPEKNLDEAAHNLFSYLSQLDEMAGAETVIYVAPIPNAGIGIAINDRLARAQKSKEKP